MGTGTLTYARSRAEDLFTIGRAFSAAFILLIIWLSPPEPLRFPAVTCAILASHFIYSLLLGRRSSLRMVTHFLNLCTFSLLIFLQGGMTPWLPCFLFLQITAALDSLLLQKRLHKAAIAEERLRLARDLHDGLLQSLAGAGLQLETAQRLIESEPLVARQRVQDVQQLLVNEQRELRSRVTELRLFVEEPQIEDHGLKGRLEELAERIRLQWDLKVEIVIPSPLAVSRNMARELYLVVHESLVNAARHAGASKVQALLYCHPRSVCLTVTDDGHGFAFQGRYDHHDLCEMKRGPVTLRERISALGGTLSIESAETGARLDIELPLMEQGG